MSDFINFGDFLGLNDEAGQQMLERTLASGEQQRAAAAKANTDHAANANTEDEASYTASGEAARKATTSYATFMAQMNDPQERQGLMEKLYGRGGGWLDSAVAGAGRGRTYLDQESKHFDIARDQYGRSATDTDARHAAYGTEQAAKREREAAIAESTRLQAEEKERDELGRKWAEEQYVGGNPYNDLDAARGKMSARDRQNAVWLNEERFGKQDSSLRDKNGRVNWDRYAQRWQSNEQGRQNNDLIGRGGSWNMTGTHGAPKAGRETWDAYYAKNRKL